MSEERVLLVTGASSDVGAALIRRIGHQYGTVFAHYRSSEGIIGDLRAELGDRIVPVQADFSDPAGAEGLIEAIRRSGKTPDHIVHLSNGKARSMQFGKTDWDAFRQELDTSLRSIVTILQAFLPGMAKNRYGRVVFMLTSYVLGVPPKFQSVYITAKYAQLGLMKTLAAEYAARGVTVNAVSPDMMETKFLSDLPDLIREQSAKNNPLGRNITVDETVPAIAYLLSDESGAVTGQNIGITGGVR